ncbi:YciI family protein [Isoptericola sp. NEAU-Y5]|uniref:YciI family protein n=1 Tax=Isoptericola luteus TaxID=2879484 RepID=A0ABS7ZIR2_9MICO|nr:YciI family protein [Isoptericola sp. NEAU-Y5]MCA5894916.1 YciI family protein [Isoptericola sp. NEAU-Y5]
MRYALLLHNDEPAPGDLPAEGIAEMERLFGEYGDALARAGVLVSGEVLQFSPAATTVTRRTGTTQIQDGPFAETKEALAGIFVVDVPDVDAAISWAERCPGATYGSVEVRPVATSLIDGAWTQAGPAA